MNEPQVKELVLQSLETELGGVEIYKTALRCVVNDDLREEWEKYLEETQTHVEIVTTLAESLGIDPEEETPGRSIVRGIGKALVEAMNAALKTGDKSAAQLVAAECVVLGETKDHHNWELIGEASKKAKGAKGAAFKEAYEKVEDEEDEHLYHTAGWARELWIESLGMPAVIPPPEEEKDVKTAIGAARAKKARAEML